jgi:hypothetical protein
MVDKRQVLWIGEGVQDIRNQPGPLQIFGDTSKGIFFKHPSKRILFVSRETARGPLTIVLAAPGQIYVRDDAQAELTAEGILIDQELEISFEGTRIWQPAQFPQPGVGSVQSMTIRAIRLRSLLEGKQESLLNRLPLFPEDPDLSTTTDTSLYERFQPLMDEFGKAPQEKQIEVFGKVIGFGRGLTPGGDDFLCGMILGMVRYGIHQDTLPDVDELQRVLVKIAYQSTTLISANILDFAFRGQSDERIITGLDEILSPNPKLALIESSLFEWGNTSGLDTLAGLVFLLKTAGKLV